MVDSPIDVQRRGIVGDTSPGIAAKASRKPQHVEPMGEQGSGDRECSSEDQVQVISAEKFRVQPTRPEGNKSAKHDLLEAGRRETTLKLQARAAEQMAAANMRKAQVMEDQSALFLFRLLIDDDLDEEARKYLKLRRKEEMERIKRRMESERRTAEREETDVLLRARFAINVRERRRTK
jgi:hypothetical protein